MSLEEPHRDEVQIRISKDISGLNEQDIVEVDATNKYGASFRARVVIFLIVTFVVYYAKNNILPTKQPECFQDMIFDLLDSMNKLVNENQSWLHFFQLSSSGMMDCIYLSLFLHWTFYGVSCRILVSMAGFYGIRAFTMSYFLLGFPKGYVWGDPGFPSIVVPYSKTSDFFFSGHCGFLMLVASEWYTLGYKKMCYLTHFVNFYMAFVMVMCRIHYSVDISTGVIYAHYIYLVVRYYCPELDAFFIRIWGMVGFAKTDPEKEPFLANANKMDSSKFKPKEARMSDP